MIYIFNGPPGSGKDEGCLYYKKLGMKHLSFKDELFIETIKHYNVDTNWFFDGYTRVGKDLSESTLDNLSRREALIHVSEDLIKPKYGEGHFGEKLSEKLDTEHNFCISDGGFFEELLAVINKVGIENITIIQLTREKCNFSKDSRSYFEGNLKVEFVLGGVQTPIDPKKTLSHIPVPIFRINNNGSIEEFYKILDAIYKGTAWKTKPKRYEGSPMTPMI